MRTLVVGDIHGGLKALKQVLERAAITPTDQLIFVGDYVDGWSESAETILFLISLAKTHQTIFLRGNHEELVFNYLSGKESSPMWLEHGGKSSITSFSRCSSEEISQCIQFLKALKNYYIDSENLCFIHAGFTNLKGPAHEYFPNTVYWDRTLWEVACSLDRNISEEDPTYPKRLTLFKEIFIGHTPVFRIGKDTPTNFANVWNVDTGAAFKGKLSILDIDTKEFWQSDEVWTLYSEEQGRN